MSTFYRGLVFGQVREDPAVELSVCPPEVRRGFIIASAGDTAFALSSRPGRWTAVDLNARQIELCLLKKRLLAAADLESLQRLNRAGRVDRMLDALAFFYRTVLQRQGEVESFLLLDDPDEQRRRFEERWNGRLWRWCFQAAAHPWLLRLVYGSLIGRFPPGYRAVLREQVEAALCERPARDNVYLWQLFLARYPPGRLPFYMTHPVGDVEFACADALGWLRSQPDASVDFFGCSNVLEVASDGEVSAFFRELARVGSPGAPVVLRWILPRAYPREGGLRFEPELSRRAGALESGCFCRTVDVFRVCG